MGLRDFIVRISARDDGFTRTAEGCAASLNKLGAVLGRYASAGYLAHMARDSMRSAEELQILSDRSGMTVKQLQELNYAATLTHSTVNDFALAFSRLGIAQVKAAGGSKMMVEALATLGFSMQDVTTKSRGQLWDQFTKFMAGRQVTPAMERAMALVFSRGYRTILPALTQGIDEFAEHARQAGVVVDESVNAALARMNEKLEEGTLKWKTWGKYATYYAAKGLTAAYTMVSAIGAGIGAGTALGFKSTPAERTAAFNEAFFAKIGEWNKEWNDTAEKQPSLAGPTGAEGWEGSSKQKADKWQWEAGSRIEASASAKLGLYTSFAQVDLARNLAAMNRQLLRELQEINKDTDYLKDIAENSA